MPLQGGLASASGQGQDPEREARPGPQLQEQGPHGPQEQATSSPRQGCPPVPGLGVGARAEGPLVARGRGHAAPGADLVSTFAGDRAVRPGRPQSPGPRNCQGATVRFEESEGRE